VHATDKMLKELGDKVSGEERVKIESALAGVKDAIKGDNKSTIETKLKALEEASGSVAQRLYAQQQGGASGGPTGGAQPGGGAAGGDDNVVDAEFEEVKDDKKGT
jgi:molecular chaperone DnaK